MKKSLVALPVLLLTAGILAGTTLFYSRTHAASTPGSENGAAQAGTLQQRAIAAYKAGNYKDALPLFNDWAKQAQASNDKTALQIPVAYITDINGRIDAARAGSPQKAPLDQATLLANAQAAANAPVNADDAPRVPHKKPQPGEIVESTIKELGNFPFDPSKDTDVPSDVHLLEGAKVRVSGFMMPMDESFQISHFALMPSLVSCCFGQPPGPEHTIECRTPPDKAIGNTLDEIVVEGTLHVRVKRQDDYTYSIWEMDVRSVKPKE